MADNSALDIILDELRKYGGRQKPSGLHKMVCCPFHKEKTPSCNVKIRVGGSTPVGSFNCFGCEAHGNWNKFAIKAGLKQIKQWQLDELSLTAELEDKDVQEMLGSEANGINSLLNKFRLDFEVDWNVHLDWRGFEGQLIQDLGCRAVVDNRTNELNLLCPVSINGEIVGGIKALIEKKAGQLSYLTSPGSWVKNKGLFPYDYVKKMMRKTKQRYVVLVEGPRDAIRLIRDGIPALAVLGALNFSDKKALLLSTLAKNLDRVYIMPDNDSGGDTMAKVAKSELVKVFNYVSIVKLPKRLNKRGELIKIDPCNADDRLIQKFKAMAEEL